MDTTWKILSKRTPEWWGNAAERLPCADNPLVNEVLKVEALRAALNGDYDMLNRMEFEPARQELCKQLSLDPNKVLGEPIYSPNSRMVGLRLYESTEIGMFDEDGNDLGEIVVEAMLGIWAAFTLDGRLIADHGLVDNFRLENL